MTDDVSGTQGKGPIGKILIAVIVVSAVIIAAVAFMFMPDGSDSDDIELETGDYLGYTVTTTYHGNRTVGSSLFSMDDGHYLSVFSPGVDLQEYGLLSDYYDSYPILQNATIYDDCMIERHPISTDLGEKNVKTYARSCSTNKGWFLVITDAGADSNLIYRWTLSNNNTTIVIALKGTNIDNADRADQRWDFTINFESFYRIGQARSYSLGPGGEYGGCHFVEIQDGDRVTYNATGMEASVYFISIDQIQSISQTALFQYNGTMSSTHVTEKDVQGVPGWYIVLSMGTVTSDNGTININWGC